MTLTLADKKWVEDKIIDGVLEGIHEVIMPTLEGLEERLDEKIGNNTKGIKSLSKQVDNVEAGLSRMERKLDIVIGHQAEKLDEHRDRLEILEGRIGLNVT